MLLALAAGLALGAACSLDPKGTCSSSVECYPGLVCTNGVCVGCQSSADCPAWASCGGSHRCELQPGRCSSGTDCANYQVCDASNSCALRPGTCQVAGDCQAWEACTSHVCVNPAGRCGDATDCQAWEVCDATHSCADAPFAEGEVLLWGTLSEGACWLDAVAPVTAPTKLRVGLDCNASSGGAMVGPAGQIIYRGKGNGIYRFHSDRLSWDQGTSRWQYPADPQANDQLIIPATPCAGGLGITAFAVQAGTGAVNYACFHTGAGNDWFDQAGGPVVANFDVKSWTAGGHRLGIPGPSTWNAITVLDPAGTATTVTGLPSHAQASTVRTHGEAFWLAFPNSTATGTTGMELWDVDGATGVAVKVGDYAVHPAYGYGGEVLDGAGKLYFRDLNFTTGDDVIVKLPLQPAAAELVYSEADAPANANDFSSPIFHAFVKIHISSLITSP
jgi:hypothetical protein